MRAAAVSRRRPPLLPTTLALSTLVLMTAALFLLGRRLGASAFHASTTIPAALRSARLHRTTARPFAAAAGTGASMEKRVLVPIADGSEEIESVTIIDVLVRAGAKVTVASVMPEGRLQVTCSRGVQLVADKAITECAAEEWDLLVCPGGLPGADHLRDCPTLTELLKKQAGSSKLYGAICAAPAVVLQTHGLLAGKHATCYPADRFTGTLEKYAKDTAVVVDGNAITSQGPGTSMAFALRLVDLLCGPDKAKEVAGGLLAPYP